MTSQVVYDRIPAVAAREIQDAYCWKRSLCARKTSVRRKRIGKEGKGLRHNYERTSGGSEGTQRTLFKKSFTVHLIGLLSVREISRLVNGLY